MNRRDVLRLAGTLLLVFVFGVTSVASAPASTHFGAMWPAGLASGALLIASRRMAPFVTALIALLAALGFALGGYPAEVSVGYGVGAALEAFLVQQVLTAGWTRRAYLRSNSDFGRFVLACTVGATAGALAFTAVSALTSFGTPWKVGLATLGTHGAAQIVLLGLFKESHQHVGDYGPRERWAAWFNTFVVTI